MKKKKQIAYLKLESCGGCINSFFTNKNIFEISEYFEINEYDPKKDYDLVMIEGCSFTEKQKMMLAHVEKSKKQLVYFGSCSISPGDILGIELEDVNKAESYKVLYGCPVSEDYLFNFLKDYISDIKKDEEFQSVCKTCQEHEIKCIKKEGISCDGEVTIGPCEILCPKIKKSCTGCRTRFDVRL